MADLKVWSRVKINTWTATVIKLEAGYAILRLDSGSKICYSAVGIRESQIFTNSKLVVMPFAKKTYESVVEIDRVSYDYSRFMIVKLIQKLKYKKRSTRESYTKYRIQRQIEKLKKIENDLRLALHIDATTRTQQAA
jgi:hypothetical protein